MDISGSYRLVLVGVVSFVVILSASATVRSQRASRLVESVGVMGNRRLPQKEILTHVKTRAGNRYSPRQVQRDLEALLALGWFVRRGTRVSTEPGLRGGVVVTFEVQELPLILDVKLEGLGRVQEADVIDALLSERINLTRGAVYDLALVRQARFVIQRFLALRGRPNVAVEVFNENVTSMSVRLTFVITSETKF